MFLTVYTPLSQKHKWPDIGQPGVVKHNWVLFMRRHEDNWTYNEYRWLEMSHRRLIVERGISLLSTQNYLRN